MSQEKLDQIKGTKDNELEQLGDLSPNEKKQIEEDVREIAGIKDIDAPVILDFETVKVIRPGKYILDIPNLFSKKRPLVYKLEDGKYIIDITAKKFGKNDWI